LHNNPQKRNKPLIIKFKKNWKKREMQTEHIEKINITKKRIEKTQKQ
jgi:hypothetical protein